MRKAIITAFMLILTFSLTGQEQKQKVKEMYEKAYIYKENSLLISKSEFNCSFFITDKMAKDIVIIGAKQKWLGKEFYSDSELLFDNFLQEIIYIPWRIFPVFCSCLS